MSSTSGSGGKIARALGGMALQGLKEALTRTPSSSALDGSGVRGEVDKRPEPPVVAQLMIEIRSDGSHTIARGALHDLRANESAQVHAEGQTPAQLISSLLGSLLSLPSSVFSKPRSAPQIKTEKHSEALPSDKDKWRRK